MLTFPLSGDGDIRQFEMTTDIEPDAEASTQNASAS